MVLLAAATVAIYYRGLHGPFFFDDYTNVVNMQINSLHPDDLYRLALSNQSGPFGRPIPVLSFALNRLITPGGAFGYKAVNLVLHLIVCILLFALSRAIVSWRAPRLNANATAMIASAVWCLHPIQVSTVLYVVQRMEQMSALFTVIALLAYCNFRSSPQTGRWRPFIRLGTYFLATAAAALSKENGLLVPVLALLLEAFVFQFKLADDIQRRRFLIAFSLAIAVPIVVGAGILLASFDHLVLRGYELRDFTLYQRILTESHVIWYYVRLIIFPRLRDMGFYHDDFPVSTALDGPTVLAIAGILAAIAGSLLIRKRYPLISLGCLWFLCGHLLESSIFPLELVFEHRNYLPLFGLALAGTVSIIRLLRRLSAPKLGPVIAGAVVLSLGGLTWARATTWSSQPAFLASIEQSQPDSPRVQASLALYHATLGNRETALAHWRKYTSLDRHQASRQLLRASVQCRLNDDFTAAVRRARLALETAAPLQKSFNYAVWLSGSWLSGECRKVDGDEITGLLRALAMHPQLRHFPRSRRIVLVELGNIETNLGQLDQARSDLTEAHAAEPYEVTPLLFRFYAELQDNDFNAANASIQELRSSNHGTIRDYSRMIQGMGELLENSRGIVRDLNRIAGGCLNPSQAPSSRTLDLMGRFRYPGLLVKALHHLAQRSDQCGPSYAENAVALLTTANNVFNKIDSDPTLPNAQEQYARILIDLATVSTLTGHHEDAVHCLQKAVTLTPQDPDAWDRLAGSARTLSLDTEVRRAKRERDRLLDAATISTETPNDTDVPAEPR